MLRKVNKSFNEERIDVYHLVGIICEDLFQKDENDKSFMSYFDGDDWIHDGKRYP